VTPLNVPIRVLSHAADLPKPRYMTSGSSGMDICAAVKDTVLIKPGEISLIPTGITMAIPIGFEVQIRPRSGLALKQGIGILNSPGTIDADYRGEIKIIMINLGKQDVLISRGMRIAQMVLKKVELISWQEVELLPDTERNAGGFGHTGHE